MLGLFCHTDIVEVVLWEVPRLFSRVWAFRETLRDSLDYALLLQLRQIVFPQP